MRPLVTLMTLAFCTGEFCWAARCTTALDPPMLREYENYVSAAEAKMAARFDLAELPWVPASAARESAAKLEAGKSIRCNINDPAVNARISSRNATIIHWIGAIRLPRVSLGELQAILEDHDRYDRIYYPMISECRANRLAARRYEVLLGLQSSFRFASLFPQRYAFRTLTQIEHTVPDGRSAADLHIHLRAGEIRESDSGVPGRNDYLEPFHDHGIMWALNAYWRARARGPDLYMEFETITLARSVEAFSCRLGFIPVPKSVVSAAMDSLPADSVRVILEGTRAECGRRAAQRLDKGIGR